LTIWGLKFECILIYSSPKNLTVMKGINDILIVFHYFLHSLLAIKKYKELSNLIYQKLRKCRCLKLFNRWTEAKKMMKIFDSKILKCDMKPEQLAIQLIWRFTLKICLDEPGSFNVAFFTNILIQKLIWLEILSWSIRN